MEIKTLCRAGRRRHIGSLTGIFFVVFLFSLSLVSVLTVWRNSEQYVRQEMERLGFGTLTAWVSGLPDGKPLTDEIAALPEVEKIGIQSIIFSDYEINGQESDSEGQLVKYDPENYPYKIFDDDLRGYTENPVKIRQGDIYVSASLQSMFGARIGDEIHFRVARNGEKKAFTVRGWIEDPFMGSSMIGMKSFLIGDKDYQEIAGRIEGAGIDGLARTGFMLHIFKEPSAKTDTAKWSAYINQNTRLLQYAEFTHSNAAIYGFMMTLQNVFTGILTAFVLIAVLVSLVVLAHSIGTAMEQDQADTGILKTIGVTTKTLRIIQMRLFLLPVIVGMAAGLFFAIPVSQIFCSLTTTTTGMLIPAKIPVFLSLLSLLFLFGILAGFIYWKTAGIESVTPMKAIRSADWKESAGARGHTPIRRKGLCFWLALRQVAAGKRRYAGVFVIAILLVFFTSVIGRIHSWLGEDGKGLMDAFNPADLHIAAQPMGKTTMEEVEQTIKSYTGIANQYMLAMPGVSVEGMEYTANVITQPERFHMLRGLTCLSSDEIVLTEFVAADLNVEIGDSVLVSTGERSAEYMITGIYQCANDMGANVGLSREGYLKIGQEVPNMWCVHYFLEDEHMQTAVFEALDQAYGGDVALHENSWPGLYGILAAMKILMYFMYATAVIMILIITILTGSKLLTLEQKDMGIYCSFGLNAGILRLSFTLRFGMVSLAGAAGGLAVSALLTDGLVGALLRSFGISNFSSRPDPENILFPFLIATGAFVLFSWLVSGKIKNTGLSILIAK